MNAQEAAAKWKELNAARTPGAWEQGDEDKHLVCFVDGWNMEIIVAACGAAPFETSRPNDAAAIVHAVNTYQTLLDRIDYLERRLVARELTEETERLGLYDDA